MAKYFKNQKSTHIPLDIEEPKAIKEEIDEFMEEINEAARTLQRFRKEKKWTEAELAKKANTTEEMIKWMESGKQPIDGKLAKKFGELFETDHHQFL